MLTGGNLRKSTPHVTSGSVQWQSVVREPGLAGRKLHPHSIESRLDRVERDAKGPRYLTKPVTIGSQTDCDRNPSADC